MKRTAIVLALLTGCATVPDPSKMSPEQLGAMARDRNASVSCVRTGGLVYDVVAVWAVLDRATLGAAGSFAVGADCAVTITVGP